MSETSSTRRDVVKGVGAIGIVAATGSAVVVAQETQTDGAGLESAAVRAAHASPDAPAVDVNLTPSVAVGDEDQEDPVEVKGLEYGKVSDYDQFDPGTYRVRITPAAGVLQGLLEDIFGGGQDETAIFEGEMDLESGTTYTVVAFGEVVQTQTAATPTAETPAAETETPAVESPSAGTETPTGGGASGQSLIGSLNYGEHASFEVDAGDYTLLISETAGGEAGAGGTETPEMGGTETETPGMAETETPGMMETETPGMMETETPGAMGTETPSGGQTDGGSTLTGDRGFQVAALEDDLSDPGEETARVRVFHAVPDAGAVSVRAVTEGTTTDEEGVRAVDVSLEGGAAYSGFAIGYFDPEAATAGGGNSTETGAAETETPAIESPETSAPESPETETPSETPTTATDVGGEPPAFELVTVKDSQDGDRADGGTGGLF